MFEMSSFWIHVVWQIDRGTFACTTPTFSAARHQVKHVLFAMVPYVVQLQVSRYLNTHLSQPTWQGPRFPLDIVFRIYDNCLANGIEAIFAFSIVLLQKNEAVLLTLKFDEILSFLKTSVFERYKVSKLIFNFSRNWVFYRIHDRSNLQMKMKGAEKVIRQPDITSTSSCKTLFPWGSRHSCWMPMRTSTLIWWERGRHMPLRWIRSGIVTGCLLRKCKCLSLWRLVTWLSDVLSSKELDASLAQLNAEHVDVLVSWCLTSYGFCISLTEQNQLVMARLRNEEMEEELVRYKLLSVLFARASRAPRLIQLYLLVMQKQCIGTRMPCRPIVSQNHKWTTCGFHFASLLITLTIHISGADTNLDELLIIHTPLVNLW